MQPSEFSCLNAIFYEKGVAFRKKIHKNKLHNKKYEKLVVL